MSLKDAEKTCLLVIQEILNTTDSDKLKIYEITNALNNLQILRKARYDK